MRLSLFHHFPLILVLTTSIFLSTCTNTRSNLIHKDIQTIIAKANPVEYKLMTYNIRHGVGMDRILNLERTANVIKVADPDILIMNEVDHGTARSFGVLQADSLGKLLQMTAIFARSIEYDGGEYGNALLTKLPVLSFHISDLATDSLLEGRSVFLASLDLGEDTLYVMGTHLGLDPEEQIEQVQRIIQLLPKSSALILAGDFNFQSDSEHYQIVSHYLRDGILQIEPDAENTFPANNPNRRIDYIFIGPDIKPIGIPVFKGDGLSTASDHLPQVLHFRLK